MFCSLIFDESYREMWPPVWCNGKLWHLAVADVISGCIRHKTSVLMISGFQTAVILWMTTVLCSYPFSSNSKWWEVISTLLYWDVRCVSRCCVPLGVFSFSWSYIDSLLQQLVVQSSAASTANMVRHGESADTL